jgi:hypothetical protein
MNEPQISPILWEISDEFCPRMIVVDGMILYVSAVGNPHFCATRLWIPSPIRSISSECFYDSKQFKFLVFENLSMLERIETKAFSKTSLISVVILRSVEVLGESCFLECGLLSSVTIESGSKLSRIEKQSFSGTELFEIVIPASGEILSAKCFAHCRCLSSIAFEGGSRLLEVGRTSL